MEACAVTDGGDDGCGDYRTDAGDLANTATAGIAGGDLFELVCQLFDLPLDLLPLTP